MAHPGLVPEAVPPVLAPAVRAPTAPTSYREVFSDRTRDAVFGHPAAYLAGYRFVDGGGQPVPTPGALRDQTVLFCDRQPMAFLCLVARLDEVVEVRILHRFMRYMELPGEPTTGFRDRVLGLLGDLRPNQYPVVDVPATILYLVASQVRIPTHDAMAGILATWDGDAPLGPYLEPDLLTEVVRPRNVQLVPSRYAALLVHREGVTPKQAYQEIAGAIHADGNDVACSDILTWLRTACTCRGGAGPQAGSSIVLHPLNPVHLPGAVYDYVVSKIMSDLPALRNPVGVGGTGVLGATEIATVVQALAAARNTDDHTREPRTIREAYKETYPVLLRYNRVTEATGVAQIWDRLANCQKGEQQTILQQEFAKVCADRMLNPELVCPVVTTALKQMVVSFNFAGFGPDDLGTGCNPFQVTYVGATDYYQAQESAGVSQQLDQGMHGATLSDIQAIKDKEKIRFPTDLHQVGTTLQRYAVLVQTLFQGVAEPVHPFVRSIWALATGYQNKLPFILDRYHGLAGSPAIQQAYPARILRSIQIQVYEYLRGIMIAAADDIAVAVDASPDFTQLLLDLQRGTFHTSNGWVPLPSAYVVAPVIAIQPARSAGTITTTSTTTGGGGSVASGVSALTAATTAVAQTRSTNPVSDPTFNDMALRGALGPLTRAHRPPRNDAGNEFCVGWWCKGGCYSCGRRSAHVPFASPGERERLLAYATTHLRLE
ncbi:hypothetical protein MHU86_21302 [Fragilaria crotonensis]|nr:hypothetical protein MHU86_21302 [Fragilaria crotonensis]